jgi:hypothetical protein
MIIIVIINFKFKSFITIIIIIHHLELKFNLITKHIFQ